MKKEVLERPTVTTSTFVYSDGEWAKIADRIGEIDLHAFSDPARATLEHVREHFSWPDFMDPSYINVLLKAEDGFVIGYSQAELPYVSDTVARIVRTAILPQYQRRGLVGVLMDRMEEELRARGVEQMERSVRVAYGYADAIRRHYKDRILTEGQEAEHMGGGRKFFIIKL